MSLNSAISAPTIEALYREALDLAEDTRLIFEVETRRDEWGEDEDLQRIALSCEALRSTTRMMHAIAWLLNQRAYFAGDMTAQQLHRHGRLPEGPLSDSDNFHLLDEDTREIVQDTIAFHDRIARLDRVWRENYESQAAPVHRMHERLGAAVSSF